MTQDRRLRLLSRFGLGSAAILAFAALAAADVVKMKDGREIEGKVLEQTADSVVVKTSFGKQTFKKSEVKSIEIKDTPADVFAKRNAELKKDDLAAVMDLARFASENKLRTEATNLYKVAVALDPDNEEARRALGYMRYKDGWYTKAEVDKQIEAENKEKGLVKVDGKWVSKEEKAKLDKAPKKKGAGSQLAEPEDDDAMIAKGYVKENGKWVHKDEKERKAVARRIEDALAVTPAVIFTPRFQMVCTDEESRAKAMADFAEEVHGNVSLLLADNPKAGFWFGRAKFYILNNRNSYQDFVTSILPEFVSDADMRKLALNGGGMHSDSQQPPFACSLIETEDPFDSRIAHNVGHFCIAHFIGRPAPPWLAEGFAEHVEIIKSGESNTHCSTKTTYGDRGGEIAEKASSSKNWKDLLKESVLAGEDTPLDAMKGLDLNSLDFLHLSKAWSLVHWWVETKRPEMIKFFKALKTMDQDQAMKEGFGMTMAEMDAKWREYVKTSY